MQKPRPNDSGLDAFVEADLTNLSRDKTPTMGEPRRSCAVAGKLTLAQRRRIRGRNRLHCQPQGARTPPAAPDYTEVLVQGTINGQQVERTVWIHRFNAKGDKIKNALPEDDDISPPVGDVGRGA